MDPLSPVKRFDAFQQRHTALAIPLAVVKKFGDDGAGNLAALIAYYLFFSLLPLLLVFFTILGFVLSGHPTEIKSLEKSVETNFPEINSLQLKSITGSGIALFIGVLTTLFSGLGVTGAAQNALDTVWAVPKKSRPNFLQGKGRGLMLLGSLGVLFILGTLLSGIVTAGFGGLFTKILGLAVSYLVNCALFYVAFRFMTAKSISARDLRDGVLLAAVFWTVLQALGGVYVKHVIGGLPSGYGSFATIIGLLVFLHLGAQLTLYAAELNTVTRRHLYPRSLMGPPVEPADQATLSAIAKVEERNDIQHVEVHFTEPQPEPASEAQSGPQSRSASQPDPQKAPQSAS
jgi:inner membrane protein YhjD